LTEIIRDAHVKQVKSLRQDHPPRL
jgi:hypothetical protein